MIYENNYNVADKYKTLELEAIQEIAKANTLDYAIATVNLRGDLNLGTMMRTAHLCGAKDVFILGHNAFDRRSAVGAQNYINVIKKVLPIDYNSIDDYITSQGYTAIYVEQGGKLRLEDQIIGRFCYVFGSESDGIPFEVPSMRSIELKQMGVMRSHNVGVTCGIVCYNRMMQNV